MLSCRFCKTPLTESFVDLGLTPLSNAYLRPEDLEGPERFWPLHPRVCTTCFLVQLPALVSPEEIFTEYAYFSSFSTSWVAHAERYVVNMIERFGLGKDSRVVEVASNDGYLLRHFVSRGVPVLGIEPAANVARAALSQGIPTRTEFFGVTTAVKLRGEGQGADLLLGNNVLAHVPDINDFIAGLAVLLEPEGVITMEFPSVLKLMDGNQFDTIYHEHYSYLSLSTVERMFAVHGLVLFDVEELPTHGGSLRIYARHAADTAKVVSPRLAALRETERRAGLLTLAPYRAFAARVQQTKSRLLSFLISARDAGKSIAAYGAAAKGNTLLNYCGVRSDFLDYVVDKSPHKQGRFLPGTRLPIHAPDELARTRPDYVLILPWNLRDEIMEEWAQVFSWGGKFVVPIPEVTVHDHR